jgi:hypothetical protein
MTTPPSEPKHRRTNRRRPRSNAHITCFKGPFGLGHNLALEVEDFSQSGLSMVTNVPLDVRQSLEVHLESYHLRRPIKLPAEVVWVRPQENGTYLIGVRFDRTLPYRELHHFTRV